MEGAAFSNLISYGLYYVLIIATFVPLCRIHIVDKRWGYTLLLIAVLFALNYLWQTYLPALNIWLDSLLRSFVLLGSGAYIAYLANLSPEIKNTLNITH
jgi:predicted membrane channel-forming protein YqfA (hemolysin III family)